MSLLTEPEEPQRTNNRVIILVAGAAVCLLLVTAAVLFMGGGEPEVVPEAPRAEAPAPAPSPPPPAPAELEPAPRPRAPRPRPAPEPPKEPEPPVERVDVGTLNVNSDVPGASVFLDRNYLGVTPLTVPDVALGRHQLNVSLEGYEGFAQTLEVSPGPADIMVRFKEVRLDESIEVVHKHRFGSCEGRLVATVKGIRYETSHEDAFTVPLSGWEEFKVDYLKKTLTLKLRGGRTYNFGHKQDNADALFVFQQNVDRAIARLGTGE